MDDNIDKRNVHTRMMMNFRTLQRNYKLGVDNRYTNRVYFFRVINEHRTYLFTLFSIKIITLHNCYYDILNMELRYRLRPS